MDLSEAFYKDLRKKCAEHPNETYLVWRTSDGSVSEEYFSSLCDASRKSSELIRDGRVQETFMHEITDRDANGDGKWKDVIDEDFPRTEGDFPTDNDLAKHLAIGDRDRD